jgi:hypothetical protein
MSESTKDLIIQMTAFVVTTTATVIGIGLGCVLIAFVAGLIL